MGKAEEILNQVISELEPSAGMTGGISWDTCIEAMKRFQSHKDDALNQSVALPRRLTSENGAKALLLGEFFEEHEVSFHEDGELFEYTAKVPVRWSTIKEIYAKIVSNYEKQDETTY